MYKPVWIVPLQRLHGMDYQAVMHKPIPIAQNLAQTCLRTKHFMEGSTETLPAHIAELQRLREACGGLGVDVTDAQLTGVITLFNANTVVGSLS